MFYCNISENVLSLKWLQERRSGSLCRKHCLFLWRPLYTSTSVTSSSPNHSGNPGSLSRFLVPLVDATGELLFGGQTKGGHFPRKLRKTSSKVRYLKCSLIGYVGTLPCREDRGSFRCGDTKVKIPKTNPTQDILDY